MSRPVVKPVKTLRELKDYAATITSSTAGDARFSANALLFIAELLDEIACAVKAPSKATTKRREPSEWQRFFAEGMRAGRSPAEIGKAWRER